MKRGRKIYIGYLLGICFGGFLLWSAEASPPPQKENSLKQAKKLIHEKEWYRAGQLLKKLNNRFFGAGAPAETLYWLSYCLEKQGEEFEAFNYINRLIEAYPKSRWLDDAKILRVRISADLVKEGFPKYRKYIMEAAQIPGDEAIDLKMVAVDALIRVDGKRAFPLLSKLFQETPNRDIKEHIFFILHRYGETEMIERLSTGGERRGLVTIIEGPGIERDTKFKTVPPRVIRRIEPAYPEKAIKDGISGRVTMAVLVDKRGNVAGVDVPENVHPILRGAAVSAMKKWKFVPHTRHSARLFVTYTITMNFELE